MNDNNFNGSEVVPQNNGGFQGDFQANKKKQREIKPMAIVFAIIGIILAVRVIIAVVSYDAELSGGGSLGALIAAVIMGFVSAAFVPAVILTLGFWFIFDYPKKLAAKRANCTRTVDALLSDYKVTETKGTDENGDEHTNYWYSAVYEYNYNNFDFKTTSTDQSGKKPRVGVNVKLLINPYYPTEIYEVENEYEKLCNAKIAGIILSVIGELFLIFTAIV